MCLLLEQIFHSICSNNAKKYLAIRPGERITELFIFVKTNRISSFFEPAYSRKIKKLFSGGQVQKR